MPKIPSTLAVDPQQGESLGDEPQKSYWLRGSAPRKTVFENLLEKMLENDPKADRLGTFFDELEEFNNAGNLVTFDAESDTWIPWARPVIRRANGTIQSVDPSMWKKLRNFQPPLCPHSKNKFRTHAETQMVLRRYGDEQSTRGRGLM
ncbi:hypothetical protein DXG01_010308 [Tephrocybe rancida]|nr:hypothetical protein DXG01_010308 [Tephrocybe rancida]